MNQPAIAIASQPAPQERRNLDAQADYSAVELLPQIWSRAAQQFGDGVALHAPHSKPEIVLTYQQLWQQIQQFAAGLQALGVEAESHVALYSENSPRWFIADQGTMAAGAVNAVRSSQADREELLYILRDSKATVLIAENQDTVKKLRDRLDELPIKLVILLSDEEPEAEATFKMVNFDHVLELGRDRPLQPDERSPDSLATLLYTSGTTGKPKGVMLSHRNLMHQVTTLPTIVCLRPGDRVLSILPTWHTYERTCEYFLLSQGCTQIYTNLRYFKRDLKELGPHYVISVPRLLEALHDGVHKQFQEQSAQRQQFIQSMLKTSQTYIKARRIVHGLSLEHQRPSMAQRLSASAQMAALAPVHALADRLIYRQVREAIGGNLKQTICGGGALAPDLDDFFEIIGIEVLEGYGLTETSPVLTARRDWHNLRGSAGKPILETEIRIADPETRKTLTVGQKGLVLARGPQIMKGYYQNPEATQKVIDDEGWFNTEDLGWLTAQQDLVLTGRAKDTIVLSNGENVEPQPIENACIRSPFIDQIVVVGQDQRSLGALIVPNLQNLEHWAIEHQLRLQLPEEYASQLKAPEQSKNFKPVDLNSQPIQDLYRQELNREVKNRPGFNPNDRIGPFRLLLEPFSQENGMLTQTLKIKRAVVFERYHDLIVDMFR